ncbi:MAG: hypothetical protein JAZ16_06885 [Candidatus Thiodiazotropha taylori]|nr:hypothetical protein [Candidatus Thiodiazotropha taylori]
MIQQPFPWIFEEWRAANGRKSPLKKANSKNCFEQADADQSVFNASSSSRKRDGKKASQANREAKEK